jgi:hypothetical protein
MAGFVQYVLHTDKARFLLLAQEDLALFQGEGIGVDFFARFETAL